MSDLGFLDELERIIGERLADSPEGSYTVRLAREGIRKVAQKVGEEGVELALAGVAETDERVAGEAADLLYHLLLLLRLRGLRLADVAAELERRHARHRMPTKSNIDMP
ncbi:MAG TPA: phosphoribosyl-ATP diphosphatase [Gammaproteobacteria bacterium]|nr:phosphoribosyl-ATP diphosphatase [Gammaproteobacteria bacterium]